MSYSAVLTLPNAAANQLANNLRGEDFPMSAQPSSWTQKQPHGLSRAFLLVAAFITCSVADYAIAQVVIDPSPLVSPSSGNNYDIFQSIGITDTGYAVANSGQLSSEKHAVGWNTSGGSIEMLTPTPSASVLSTIASLTDLCLTGTSVGYTVKYSGSTYIADIAARWDTSGNVTELPNDIVYTGASTTNAVAISPDGNFICGDSTATSQGYHAIRWKSGVMAELPYPVVSNQIHTEIHSIDVNNNGFTIGYSKWTGTNGNTLSGTQALLWDATGSVVVLRDLGTGSSSFSMPKAINANGISVGTSNKYTSSGLGQGRRAVKWNTSGSVTELLYTNPSNQLILGTTADCINDSEVIGGLIDQYSSNGSLLYRGAARWSSTGIPSILEKPDASSFTTMTINSISPAGLIAGSSYKNSLNFNLSQSAYYWKNDGMYVDLNSLISPSSGWILDSCTQITDNGWVTGMGRYYAGGISSDSYRRRAFRFNTNSSNTSVWINRNGGVWSGGSNWVSGVTPSNSTPVFFDRPTTYTVSTDTNIQSSEITISNGEPTLIPGTSSIQSNGDLYVIDGKLNIPATLRVGVASPGEMGVKGKIHLNYGHLKAQSLLVGGDPTRFEWNKGIFELDGGSTDIGFDIGNQTLAGTGTVNGNVNMTSPLSIVSPGYRDIGTLSINGNFSNQFGKLDIVIATSGFDRLLVHGIATLGDLSVSALATYVPTPGQQYIILDADSLIGTFYNKANNSTFLVQGRNYRINYDYAAGTVILTALPEPTCISYLGLGCVALIRRPMKKQ